MVSLRIVLISILFCLIFASCTTLSKQKGKIETEPLTIYEVSIDHKMFNTSKGEVVTISYRTSKPTQGIIKVFDPDTRLIRDLMPETSKNSNMHTVIWDGRDLEGNIVPDEAYFFTVEAMDDKGNFTFYRSF